MKSIIHKTARIAIFLLSACFFQACEDLPLDEDKLNENEFYKLLIIPPNPDSRDLIMLIENTCGIEPEPVLTFEGNQIHYKRYFNSLMGAPCSPQLDTTTIGPLNSGSYELLHWVIDKNHLLTDSIISIDTLALVVK